MNVNINKEDSNLTIEIEGRLDTLTSPELEKEVDTALDGITNLVVDLKNLEYISSAGLRVLLGVAQVMEDQGDMKVINVSSEVMDIFEVTGFDEVLTIE
ncbi:MAG: STAS domain-containing protein [Lachnospiraceae bacterium]|jgi:anti-sigma B factor antagonist|nr:STAS domain-containing protein [Lachnospiraceae bacterium]MBQ5475340.1 STAS domain-containing protein [Lachnospiraceae bacterium]